MSKVKFVSPSGKIVELGAKALNSTSLRNMGFKPYEEVIAPVPPVVPVKEVVEPIANPVSDEKVLAPVDTIVADEQEATDEQPKPKRGRPRKNTMSDADKA
jgi:hypothetical protein